MPAYELPNYILGHALLTGKLWKADQEPMVGKVHGRLPTWKAGLLHRAGRLALVKSTLTAIPIYPLISIKLHAWAIEAINKIQRGFFWVGQETAPGEKCMMAWPMIARPCEYGGLGIIDLKFARYVLTMRWLWFQRTAPSKPWANMPLQCDPEVKAMFDAFNTIQPGDGKLTQFWTDR